MPEAPSAVQVAVVDRGMEIDERPLIEVQHPGDVLVIAVTAAPGSWGGQRLSLGGYVTVTRTTDRATAARGRSCCPPRALVDRLGG